MENTEKLLTKVRDLIENKKYNEANEVLSKDLLEDLNDVNFYIEKSRILGNLEKYHASKSYAEKALNVDPKNSKAYYYIGKVYQRLKNYHKAIENCNRAIEINPNDSLSYEGLGNVYFELKNFDEAIRFYEKSIELDPENLRAYNGLGNAYIKQKNYTKAKESYEEAIKIDENYYYPYNGLGSAYFYEKDYEKAIELYTNYIKLNPNWDGAYLNRANTFFLLKKYSEALEDFEKYIEIAKNKDEYNYREALHKIEELKRILGNKNYEEISKIIDKIKELLIYNDGCVTHFTSLSTSKILIIENSRLRLSEGAFLNDTSEGTVLFKYLKFRSNLVKNVDTIDEVFTQKPFIGSFVSETKHNDLAMWRMYGKEQQEEAKGCAITINVKGFRENIYKILDFDKSSVSFGQDFMFYRVCYIDEKGKFIIPDIKDKGKKEKELSDLMESLKSFITKYNDEGNASDINKVQELINEISFLVKNSEYSYEKEIRLVVNGVGFKKNIESKEQPRVYIELASLRESITKITLGPKVEKSDEWASVFHYSMENDGFSPEVHISHLPYK